MIIMNMDRR
jgi:hypothetical protein